MNKFRLTIKLLVIAIFTFAFASLAQAQATRTWVSGVGDDANPCSRTAPCKTFAGAISKTAAGGEIDVLDPGGFGAVTINKAMTLDGGGGQNASILTSGTNGIVINGGASDVITLNNLKLQGISQSVTGGLSAIKINSGKGLHVNNCIIENWTVNGIDDVRTTGGYLEVDNTSITNITGNGISVNPSSGSTPPHVHVANSHVEKCGSSGLSLGSGAQATVFNSVFTQSAVAGIFVQQTAGGTTEANIDHCVVSNSVAGFQANTSSSIIRVSNTTAIGNSNLAVTAGGGLVSSYGNNQTAGATFPSPPTGQQ